MPEGTEPMLADVGGIVLDVGSGSGESLRFFDATKIRTLYTVEPAAELHPGLRQRADRLGLGGKLHIIPSGAQRSSLLPALHRAGLIRSDKKPEPIFDEIVCCRVLCGVPHLEDTVEVLYGLLKPNGRLSVCEHVRNPWQTQGSLISRFFQIVYTVLGWPFFMGGCELNRNTPTILKELKGGKAWSEQRFWISNPQAVVPFFNGTAIKSPALAE
jgi:SAM-dependent methyltransferase